MPKCNHYPISQNSLLFHKISGHQIQISPYAPYIVISYYLLQMSLAHLSTENQLTTQHHSPENPQYVGPFLIQHEGKYKMEEKEKKVGISEWTVSQNVKYTAFILEYGLLMQGKPYVKLWRVFGVMSEFIATRNIRQCKLYHQKMVNKYGKINQIVENMQSIHHNLLALAKQESIPLNRLLVKKLTEFKESKRHQQLQQEMRDQQNHYMWRFEKTAQNYLLELTLLAPFDTRPMQFPDQDPGIYQSWSVRLNRFPVGQSPTLH